MSFLGEIKRRKLFQVAAVYAVVAWLIVQIVATVEAPLRLPDWFDTAVIVLLAIGFPVTLMMSWAFNLTADGLIRDEGSERSSKGRTIEYVLIALLAVAVGWVIYRVELAADVPLADTAAPAESLESSAPAEPPRNVLPNSIAVLPFENLSPDPDDAYFADGLHEEVLNQLVKLSSLSVISRTTMMRYADEPKSPPEVADDLNVESVMEGSVRYAGDNIRVTLQLIDPETDLHLWSETYDGDMSDVGRIFAIQSDIAMNVANALEAQFSVAEQARIEQIPTQSTEAYSLYLAAKAFQERWTRDDFLRGIERIDRALELDPGFALGWVAKAQLHSNAPPFFPESAAEHVAAAEQAILRALEVDPSLPEAHARAALVWSASGQWLRSEAALRQAIANGMSEAEASPWGAFRYATGHFDGLHETLLRVSRLNPLDSTISFFVTGAHDGRGDPRASMLEYDRGRELFEEWGAGHYSALITLLGNGEHDRAFALAAEELSNPVVDAVLAYADAPAQALAALRELAAEGVGANDARFIALFAAYFGDQRLALSATAEYIDSFAPSALVIWRPVYRDMRREEGFKTLMREQGFVAHWQEYGWPDLCRPIGNDDFECD